MKRWDQKEVSGATHLFFFGLLVICSGEDNNHSNAFISLMTLTSPLIKYTLTDEERGDLGFSCLP